MRAILLYLLFFASGVAALIYQVLWLRELALLFGSTASATAITVAIFFGGMAIGSEVWGRRAARAGSPLAVYALLEIGIAVCALGHFLILDAYHALYAPLFQRLLDWPVLLSAAKALLAAGVLLPAAVLMGGTFPMIAQQLIRRTDETGRRGGVLYALNTLGGMAGVVAAGFVLPRSLGYTRTYWVAIAINLLVAALALLLRDRHAATGTAPAGLQPVAAWRLRGVEAVAIVSGFATLGLEVLWTRMFAQVLHNSVYSFAAILATFLAALGIGSFVASRLVTLPRSPGTVLYALTLLAGIGVGLTPFLFYAVTSGLSYVGAKAAFWPYIAAVFGTAAAVMLIPGIAVGTVFPYLLKSAGARGGSAGLAVGRLAAVNTMGGVAGALVASFVLLPWLGLWGSIKTLALLYLAVALAMTSAIAPLWRRVVPIVVLLLFATVLDPTTLPIVGRNAAAGEALLDVREGRDAIVAVIRDERDLRIKVDNFYALGGTSGRTYEETQADVPLMIHAQPKSVFFLGMGTGITAAAALRHPVQQVTTCEILPDVVRAARLYFAKYTKPLFTDPRSTVIVDDGRSFLLGTGARYDVIIGDLFVPWNPGASGLYSREHFEVVRSRLMPGGVFAQWLPLYQLSRQETLIIARTMLDVFPQVSVWRGDFLGERPIVALVGQESDAQLDAERLVENFRRRRQDANIPRPMILGLMALFYAGNLTANHALFTDVPANTDDWPLIELFSPITQRQHWGAGQAWFTSLPLAEWYDQLFAVMPPERDPYLASLSDVERGYVHAGLSLFKASVYKKLGRAEDAARFAADFRDRVPVDVARMFDSGVNDER